MTWDQGRPVIHNGLIFKYNGNHMEKEINEDRIIEEPLYDEYSVTKEEELPEGLITDSDSTMNSGTNDTSSGKSIFVGQLDPGKVQE
mmetsp:Transcript_19761/g.27787  ORF Transcript_19761/g.27787 Transcript_19761/m.27787 type:complete len:87 (+) Transcript_19761:1476-1736(+)